MMRRFNSYSTALERMIDLSIVIVNWNVADYLQRCLSSIFSCSYDLSVEVIVVDCASTDHSVNVLQNFPNVYPIVLSTNIGFSAASNIGISSAHGRYIMLLNPDTEVIDHVLEDLVWYLDHHPKVGIVGPRTLNSDGTIQPTKRRFPTFLTSIFSLKKNSPRTPGKAPDFISDYYYANHGTETDVIEVDWVQGSAIVMRKELYDQIGGIDEQFWMYHEEIDLCRRAKNAGWKIVYVGTTSIIHHQGKSSQQVIEQSLFHWKQSRIKYFRKHHGWIAGETQRLLLWIDACCPFVILFLQSPFWFYSMFRRLRSE